MVKIYKENAAVDFQLPLPTKSEKPVSWAGRLIRFLRQTLSIFKLNIWRLLKKDAKASEASPIKAKSISKDNLILAQQIQQAEKMHHQEWAALHYIQRMRANDTASILIVNIEPLMTIMGQPNYQSQLSSNQIRSFLDEGEKLKNFLNQKKAILAFPKVQFGKPLPAEQELTPQQVMDHLKEIFDSLKVFHFQIKEIHSLLSKELPEHKQFAVYATKLIHQVQQQQRIYKNPSSDNYLCTLQIREKQALQTLKSLKQQAALREIPKNTF